MKKGLKMKTEEILKLQALKLKKKLLDGASDRAEGLPVWMLDAEPSSDSVRNICALISAPLFEEIERLSGVLSMSKRRFVELALRDFAQKANQAIEGVGLTNVTHVSMGQVPVDEA
jgi:hypothetical protein